MFANPHAEKVLCVMCDAPMRRAEYMEGHLEACVKIDAARGRAEESAARIAERRAQVARGAPVDGTEPPAPVRGWRNRL